MFSMRPERSHQDLSSPARFASENPGVFIGNVPTTTVASRELVCVSNPLTRGSPSFLEYLLILERERDGRHRNAEVTDAAVASAVEKVATTAVRRAARQDDLRLTIEPVAVRADAADLTVIARGTGGQRVPVLAPRLDSERAARGNGRRPDR